MFFRRCLDIFGMGTMKDVCRRSQSQIYKYSEDTAHKDSTYQNPADLILDLFGRLCQAGRRDVAVGLVRLMADAIEMDIADRAPVTPDKATIFEEIVDDHEVLNALYSVLKKEPRLERLPLVKSLACNCKREIDENVVKYGEEATNAASRID
jgi:hypothetical protein